MGGSYDVHHVHFFKFIYCVCNILKKYSIYIYIHTGIYKLCTFKKKEMIKCIFKCKLSTKKSWIYLLTVNSHGLKLTSGGGPPPVLLVSLFLNASFFLIADWASWNLFFVSSSVLVQFIATEFTLKIAFYKQNTML